MFTCKLPTQYEEYDHGLEKLDDIDEVARIGYQSTQVQVENFIKAGVALARQRGEIYLFDGVDDDDDIIAGSPYPDDPVDTQSLLELQKEIKVRREEISRQKRAQFEREGGAGGADAISPPASNSDNTIGK